MQKLHCDTIEKGSVIKITSLQSQTLGGICAMMGWTTGAHKGKLEIYFVIFFENSQNIFFY